MNTTIAIIISLFLGIPPNITDDITTDTQDMLLSIYSTPEHKCLSEALYFEARGESINGIIAVGNVIINRVLDDRFPDSVCAVVRQKNQFSYYWDNKPDIPTNKKVYKKIQIIALDILNTRQSNKNVLYYHTDKVQPYWAKQMEKSSVIGNHIFYTN